jgi:hypothetical protein
VGKSHHNIGTGLRPAHPTAFPPTIALRSRHQSRYSKLHHPFILPFGQMAIALRRFRQIWQIAKNHQTQEGHITYWYADFYGKASGLV